MTLNVYEQYFAADMVANSVPRHAALVMLVADSEAGNIRYEAAVTFFPHNDEEDFAVSYDAYFSKVVYESKGRRSKKREQQLLEELNDSWRSEEGIKKPYKPILTTTGRWSEASGSLRTWVDSTVAERPLKRAM